MYKAAIHTAFIFSQGVTIKDEHIARETLSR